MRGEKSGFIFYLAPFLMDANLGNIMMAVPLFAIFLGASPFILGLIGFVPGVFYISLCFLFGRLSDRWERKILLILGACGHIFSSLLLIFSFSLYHFYISMAIIGIAGAMFWPTLEAFIAEMESEKPLVRRIGFFNVSWSLGLTLGPLIGGALFGIYRKLPFIFAFFMSIFLFSILFFNRKEKFYPSFPSSSSDQKEDVGFLKDSFFYKRVSRIANFSLWFSLGTIRYMFPKLGVELEFSPLVIGVLMFILPLFQTATFLFLGISERWHYRFFPLILFEVLAIIGHIVIFLGSSIWVFVLAFSFLGAAMGMTYSSSLYYSINTPSEKGSGAGIHETFLGTGAFLGSLLGGVIAQLFSLRVPYLVCNGLIGGVILIQFFMKKKISLPT